MPYVCTGRLFCVTGRTVSFRVPCPDALVEERKFLRSMQTVMPGRFPVTNPLRAAMSAGYAARTEEFPTCLPENGIPGGSRESGKRKEQLLLAVASGAENGSVRGQNRMSRRTKPLPGVQSGPSRTRRTASRSAAVPRLRITSMSTGRPAESILKRRVTLPCGRFPSSG